MTQTFSPHALRALRVDRGLSRLQLATAIRRNFHQVGAWERGRDIPNMDSLMRLMRVLECHIEDLFEDSAAVWDADSGADAGSSRTPGVGAAPASGKSRSRS
jgi:transcriptional regulator with XRE-family HTH domain